MAQGIPHVVRCDKRVALSWQQIIVAIKPGTTYGDDALGKVQISKVHFGKSTLRPKRFKLRPQRLLLTEDVYSWKKEKK